MSDPVSTSKVESSGLRSQHGPVASTLNNTGMCLTQTLAKTIDIVGNLRMINDASFLRILSNIFVLLKKLILIHTF